MFEARLIFGKEAVGGEGGEEGASFESVNWEREQEIRDARESQKRAGPQPLERSSGEKARAGSAGESTVTGPALRDQRKGAQILYQELSVPHAVVPDVRRRGDALIS